MEEFLNEGQDPKTIEKIYHRLEDLLLPEEHLLYIAVQKKPAVTISPNSVALTDRRLILFKSKSLGLLMDFEEYLWSTIFNFTIKETIFGADFTFKTTYGLEIKVDYLPKAQARKLYQISQQQKINREEAEEPVQNPTSITEKEEPLSESVSPQEKIIEEIKNPEIEEAHEEDLMKALQKLKTLLDNGLITQQDYDEKKAEILSQL
ncbi:MAG: PH domain-containing protein [Candidatus Azobacteroides sp.]|nr:PH domain-containing protein [Candidatus Azobacteroides sp.]